MGGQHVCDFGEGWLYAIKHMIFQKVSASLMKLSTIHEEQSSPWLILVFF